MANPKGNPATLTAPRFKPSVSGNPGGKPVGARNRIQGAFLNALADHFDKYGKRAIERACEDDPLGYVKAVAGLMPKQFEQTQPLEDLTDEQIIAGIALLRSGLTQSAGNGAGETETLQ